MLWQRHNLPMETFLGWPWRKRAAYIASEVMETEKPVRRDTAVYKI